MYNDGQISGIEPDLEFKFIELPDGGYYIGILKDNIPNGLGILTFPD